MAEVLVFELFGPFASWGEIAVGEMRGSALQPTRSALLGVVAAALGIPRSEEEALAKLAQGVDFAVLLLGAGSPLRDFHTYQGLPTGTGKNARRFSTRVDELTGTREELNKNTKISRRDYHSSYACEVALWRRGDFAPTLSEIREHLLHPVFALYLGRKSCPLAYPMGPEIVTADDLVKAFQRARNQRPSAIAPRIQAEPTDWTLYWGADVEIPSGVQAEDENERWDEPRSRLPWLFSARREHRAAWPTER